MLVSCPETDVEFAVYFRRRKTDTSITKKMGMLHVDQVVKKVWYFLLYSLFFINSFFSKQK